MSDLKFIWRMPAYPTEGSRGRVFIDQITEAMDYIAAQGLFDGAYLDDHFLPFTAVDQSGGRDNLPRDADTLECWTTISYLAAAYPTLNFGAIVLCQAYRNPALLAKMGATLQMLTQGRFVMSIGAGWYKDDYDAYGYEFPEKGSVRLRQMEETIQIVNRMWTESPATFSGEYYQINEAYCSPKPDPIPPLLIGGGGEKVTLKLVAKYADWWNYCDDTKSYAHKLSVLRSHCEAIGRPFDEIVKTWDGLQITIAETESKAQEIYEKSLFKRRGAIVGTPEQVAEKLKAFIDLDVTVFFLRFDDFPNLNGLKLFTEQVAPLLV